MSYSACQIEPAVSYVLYPAPRANMSLYSAHLQGGAKRLRPLLVANVKEQRDQCVGRGASRCSRCHARRPVTTAASAAEALCHRGRELEVTIQQDLPPECHAIVANPPVGSQPCTLLLGL
jgi:hypothetical protein